MKIKLKILRLQILTCFTFLVLFSKKLLLHRRRKPSEKVVIVEEELRGIDIDDIGNLEDSPRLLFINEERGNPIVANGGVFTKGKGQTFYNRL